VHRLARPFRATFAALAALFAVASPALAQPKAGAQPKPGASAPRGPSIKTWKLGNGLTVALV
jgi:hypothetical protein